VSLSKSILQVLHHHESRYVRRLELNGAVWKIRLPRVFGGHWQRQIEHCKAELLRTVRDAALPTFIHHKMNGESGVGSLAEFCEEGPMANPSPTKRLFLLDGMALVYRAHFGLINSPIYTAGGVNTSALFGFTNTLVDLIKKQEPTHIALVFDTHAPTVRHIEFPEYKANRDEMPEDLREAIPNVKRLCEAFNIPVLTLDGYEADDIIGTLARRASEAGGFETFMVTPDKDFAQLVSELTHIYKPGYRGGSHEIIGVKEVLDKWEVERPEQVIDILGLWGDASDNIPGIPKIGEKTAKKLVKQFGSVEAILENTDKLKGKQKENVENFAEQGRLSKKLATILLEVPIDVDLNALAIREPDEDKVKSLFVEFEFNAIGQRMFGDGFKAGRGHSVAEKASDTKSESDEQQPLLFAELKSIHDVEHVYSIVQSADGRAELLVQLLQQASVAFVVERNGGNAVSGLAFSWKSHRGHYVTVPRHPKEARAVLVEFEPFFGSETIEKIACDLKRGLSVLAWNQIVVRGVGIDPVIAHTLIEPEQKHTLAFMAEAYLGYTLIASGEKRTPVDVRGNMMLDLTEEKDVAETAEPIAEAADIIWQLTPKLRELLGGKGQEKVFYEIECPLVPVLVDMEKTGVALDTHALAEFSKSLQKEMDILESEIYELAGSEFNLNSPKQLGEILVDRLNLIEKPKKTKGGQYKTDKSVLSALAREHPIAEKILYSREKSKLKSTYVDALPDAINPATGRVHTTYLQLATATGRIQSHGPNLQNIPVRSDQGKEIRRAFVPGIPDAVILSADYSQIELRVMAELSGDEAMLEAFRDGHDIHAATSAKVFGVDLNEVTPDMRRTAKMVNFGIIYGITQFGLSQRLGIPRKEAGQIINDYKKQYHGVSAFMERVVRECSENGYVETITGRRRYMRDINSSSRVVREEAERETINSPIQGTAADMIKIAMVNIDRRLREGGFKANMLMQVHDELVFEVPSVEIEAVTALVTDCMKNAISMKVPVVVDFGTGINWLDAH
jgi:DNA polymerase-1